MEESLKIFNRLGIQPTAEQILTLSTEIRKIQFETAFEALKEERSRCYDFTLHCRNAWLKHRDIPQDIVIAAETILEGIQKGAYVGP